MRNVSNKIAEEIETHILYRMIFSENRAVYEIVSKNVVQPERLQMTSQCGAQALHAE
jgi:hypothetical protein